MNGDTTIRFDWWRFDWMDFLCAGQALAFAAAVLVADMVLSSPIHAVDKAASLSPMVLGAVGAWISHNMIQKAIHV